MIIFTNFFKRVKSFFKSFYETRHYSWDSLTDNINSVGFWDVVDISDDGELIQTLWNNHISKIYHLDYYISNNIIQCIAHTPRGKNLLKWRMSYGQPFYFEYGMYTSGTRYDIHYSEDFEKCNQLNTWLTENGNRFISMYERDKNL